MVSDIEQTHWFDHNLQSWSRCRIVVYKGPCNQNNSVYFIFLACIFVWKYDIVRSTNDIAFVYIRGKANGMECLVNATVGCRKNARQNRLYT